MERIALGAGAQHRGIQERQVEGRIVSHQHRAPASMAADRGAYRAKDPLQSVAFVDGRTQWMPRVNFVDQQRRRVEARVLERAHMVGVSFATIQAAIAVDVDKHSGYL